MRNIILVGLTTKKKRYPEGIGAHVRSVEASLFSIGRYQATPGVPRLQEKAHKYFVMRALQSKDLPCAPEIHKMMHTLR